MLKVPGLTEVAAETEKASRSSVYLMFLSERVSMLQFKDREVLIFAVLVSWRLQYQRKTKRRVVKTIIAI